METTAACRGLTCVHCGETFDALWAHLGEREAASAVSGSEIDGDE